MTAPYLGHAITPANTDLDLLAQNASNANANATTALANAAAAAANAAAALAMLPSPLLGRTITTHQQWVNGMGINFLNAKDYGVVGDGVADDTVAMQAALTAGGVNNCVIYCGRMGVKVTAALTMYGPGLWFDSCSYGNAGDPGILASGAAYVVLTVTRTDDIPQVAMQFCIYGTANAVDGLYLNNPFLGTFGAIRVYNILGYGVKIDKCWDCTFASISVEACVKNSVYAFSMNDAGDTCNMSHIHRLQVEGCGNRAIYISGSTLGCKIDNIHSEQITPAAGVYTWDLGSSRGKYSVGRFHSNAPSANATLHIAGGDASYDNFLVEGSIDVSIDAGSSGSVTVINSPEFQGTTHMLNGQAGVAVFVGGNVASFYDPTLATGTVVPGIKCFGTLIGSLTLGFQTNYDPTLAIFVGCTINALVTSSTHSSGIFQNCTIGTAATAHTTLLGGVQHYIGCTFHGTGTLSYGGSGAVKMTHCVINGAVSITSGTAGVTFDNCYISGAFAVPNTDTACKLWGTVIGGNYSANANPSVFMDERCQVIGTVTNGGVPNSGANLVGDTHWTPAPATAAAPGWRCTVAGNPGTWKAMANLA